MGSTIFEKIIEKELDGSFVYTDDLCVAFMDINPLNEGHVLVVPRISVARLTQLKPEVAGHLFSIAQKILKAIELAGIKSEGANIFLSDGEVAGQEVPHVHLHIVPRFLDDGIKVLHGKKTQLSERAELNRIASLIANFLD